MLRLGFMLLVVFASSLAYASKDRGVYVGGGISLVNVGIEDPFKNDVNFVSGEVSIGYKYNSYLGLEIRGGASLNDENIAIESSDVTLPDSARSSIDRYASIYYRAELANEIAKVYLLLGQSQIYTTLDFEDENVANFEADDSGLSYGVGLGLWLDERMNLNFEFKNLVVTENDSFTSAGIYADYRF